MSEIEETLKTLEKNILDSIKELLPKEQTKDQKESTEKCETIEIPTPPLPETEPEELPQESFLKKLEKFMF